MRLARREAAAGVLALLLGGPPGALRCAEVPKVATGLLESLPSGLLPSSWFGSSSQQLGSWESWYYSGDVRDATFRLRALIAQWPRTKVQAQSEDRRYLRVQFQDSDLKGPFTDDCQFYLVPTGANDGAAVVQCRRRRPGAGEYSYASNRQECRVFPCAAAVLPQLSCCYCLQRSPSLSATPAAESSCKGRCESHCDSIVEPLRSRHHAAAQPLSSRCRLPDSHVSRVRRACEPCATSSVGSCEPLAAEITPRPSSGWRRPPATCRSLAASPVGRETRCTGRSKAQGRLVRTLRLRP